MKHSGHLLMDILHAKSKNTLSAFGKVFRNGRYIILAMGIFAVGMSLVLLLPNVSLLIDALTSNVLTWGEKMAFWLSLYGTIATNFSLVNAVSIFLLVVLFSIDIALFMFYIRRAQKVTKGINQSRTHSVAGAVSGVLGIGCAACGSVILTGIATSLGATGVLLILPLHGGEFAFLGIGLLMWSIWHLAKKINDPLVCLVDA